MVGAGYPGLVSAACFAEFGWNVTCVDKDVDRIARLKRGEVPIYEPGLDALLERNARAGPIDFSTTLSQAVRVRPSLLRMGPACFSRAINLMQMSRTWRLYHQISKTI